MARRVGHLRSARCGLCCAQMLGEIVRNRDRACTVASMSKFIPAFDEDRVIAWRSGIALT